MSGEKSDQASRPAGDTPEDSHEPTQEDQELSQGPSLSEGLLARGNSSESISSFADLIHLPGDTPPGTSERAPDDALKSHSVSVSSKMEDIVRKQVISTTKRPIPGQDTIIKQDSGELSQFSVGIYKDDSSSRKNAFNSFKAYLAYFYGNYVKNKRSSNVLFKTNVAIVALHSVFLLWIIDLSSLWVFHLIAVPPELLCIALLLFLHKHVETRQHFRHLRYAVILFLWITVSWRVFFDCSISSPSLEWNATLAPFAILLCSIQVGLVVFGFCVLSLSLIYAFNVSGTCVVDNEFPLFHTFFAHLFLYVAFFMISAAAHTFAVQTLRNLKRTVVRFKDLNEKLKQSKEAAESSSDLKSQFLSNISHELTTPLAGIVGGCDAVKDCPSYAMDTKLRDAASIISYSACRLQNKLNDILVFSKLESNDVAMEKLAFTPATVLERAIQLQSRKAFHNGIEVIIDIASNLPLFVLGDKDRFEQVLRVLLGNAIKFTSEGFIKLVATVKPSLATKTVLHIQVLDTGVGISKKKQQMVFQPFVQGDGSNNRAHEGSGLGLAIAKQLVKLMDGRMWIESEGVLQVGSIIHFTCAFDRVPEEEQIKLIQSSDRWWHASVPQNKNRQQIRNLKVLVLESHPSVRRNILGICSRLGFRATEAKSLDEAFDQLVSAKQSKDEFQLFLIDQVNGEGDVYAQFMSKAKEYIDTFSVFLMESSTKRMRTTISSIKSFSDSFRSLSPSMSNTLASPRVSISHKPSISPRNALQSRLKDQIHPRPSQIISKPVTIPKLADIALKLSKTIAVSPNRSESPETKESDTRLKILVVDDNVVNRKIESRMLSKMGHETVLATNGREAIEKYFSEGDVDVILMDIFMPELSGPEATVAIREKEKQMGLGRVPIIAITANGTKKDMDICMDSGMTAYITKPVTVEKLTQTLGLSVSSVKRLRKISIPLSLKVLVVDDHSINLRLECRMLQALGHEPFPVSSGTLAVKTFREKPFDIVLMDIFMPKMSGFEAAVLIRNFELELGQRAVPIIAITANGTETDRQKALRCGMTDYITKPVSKEKLDWVICRSIGIMRNGKSASSSQSLSLHSQSSL